MERTEHFGTTGTAHWQTTQLGELRIRKVTYLKNYLADHCCQKGHIVHCLEGDFVTELESGEQVLLSKGMTYIVFDNASSNRSTTAHGVELVIIDGNFLK